MKVKLRYLLACVLIILLLVCPAFAAQFPDVDGNAEYAEAAAFVSELGIMVGDDKGNFNPNQAVTRAEMAVIVCRMLEETEGLTTSTQFADVSVEHWANPYISKAAELGIVNGYNGNFMPSDSVTYEQAVAMVIRAADGAGEAEEMGGYPQGYITLAAEFGLLQGIQAEIGSGFSRANVALLVYNLLCE